MFLKLFKSEQSYNIYPEKRTAHILFIFSIIKTKTPSFHREYACKKEGVIFC